MPECFHKHHMARRHSWRGLCKSYVAPLPANILPHEYPKLTTMYGKQGLQTDFPKVTTFKFWAQFPTRVRYWLAYEYLKDATLPPSFHWLSSENIAREWPTTCTLQVHFRQTLPPLSTAHVLLTYLRCVGVIQLLFLIGKEKYLIGV